MNINVGGVLDQSSIDAYRTSLLLKCHVWHQNHGNIADVDKRQPSDNDVAGFYSDVQEMSTTEMREFAQQNLNSQVVRLFKSIHESGYTATTVMDDIKQDRVLSKVDQLRESHGDGEGESKERESNGKTNNLIELVGFSLETKKSECADDAGDGIYLRCEEDSIIPPGTVLGIFPGLVHLPEFTNKNDYVMQNLLPDPDFLLMVRSDGAIIDGRTAHECSPNPYALAHLTNHVPKGGTPNVFQFPYDFPADPLGIEEFPKKLRKYVPNSYAKSPTFFGTVDRSAYMRGMVLLAARPLKNGEELHMDYRLNPKDPSVLPNWYHIYDEEAFQQHDEEEIPQQ